MTKKHLFWIGATMVFLCAVLPHTETLGFGLVWDDHELVAQMNQTLNNDGITGLLTRHFIDEEAGYFRPIVYVSLWLDLVINSKSFSSYHLSNVLLHSFNALLVYWLLSHFFLSPYAAIIGGLFFAVHPVHVESVAWVSGRTDLLAALFVLLATIFWWKSGEEGGASSRVFFFTSLTALLMALLSKEASFMLPPILAAGGLTARERVRPCTLKTWWKDNSSWLLGWTCVLGAVILLRLVVAGKGFGAAAMMTEKVYIGETRPSPAFIPLMWLQYIKLLVIPWPLKAWYTEHQLRPDMFSFLAAFLFLAVGTACSLKRPRTFGLFGILWAVGFFFPVSGFFPVFSAIVAERFLYLPSIGAAVIVGCGIDKLAASNKARNTALLVCAALILAMAFGSRKRAEVWRDDFTLAGDMIQSAPESTEGYNLMGLASLKAGFYGEALKMFQKSVVINPASIEGNLGLGMSYGLLGITSQEIAIYEKILALKPDYLKAYVNLGAAYLDVGNWGKAADYSLQALRRAPDSVEANNNLGKAYLGLERYPKALEAFQRALNVDPGNKTALDNSTRIRQYLAATAPKGGKAGSSGGGR